MYGQMNSTSYYGLLRQYHEPSSTFQSLSSQSVSGEFDSTAILINGYGSSSTGSCMSSGTISYISSPSSPPAPTCWCTSTSSQPPNPTPAFADCLHVQPITHVFITADLDQGDNVMHCHHRRHREGSAPASESASIILQSMTKACPYSPQERRERIQRYRTKRTRRNFNKKIQYACRKTLADSRPRIRGRFARNDDTETTNSSADLAWNQMAGGEDAEDDEHWIYLLRSISSHLVP